MQQQKASPLALQTIAEVDAEIMRLQARRAEIEATNPVKLESIRVYRRQPNGSTLSSDPGVRITGPLGNKYVAVRWVANDEVELDLFDSEADFLSQYATEPVAGR